MTIATGSPIAISSAGSAPAACIAAASIRPILLTAIRMRRPPAAAGSLTNAEVKSVVGSLCWTPFPPHGLVKVLALEDEHPVVPRRTVRVQYLHDHVGYPAWSVGRYFLDELIPLGEVDLDDRGKRCL